MSGSDYSALIVLALIGILWILPIWLILRSRRTSGREKFAWVLAILFISWFAWIFYLLLAPVKKK